MTCARDYSELISSLKKGEERAFEEIYNAFVNRLFQFVFRRIGDRTVSEEIVQEIFVGLWNRRATLEIAVSLDAYLFAAAKYSVLTYIRSERVRREYVVHFQNFIRRCLDNSNQESMDLLDLQVNIESSLSQLPEKCQTVFRLSRMEHESIPDIAARMNISTRTVENYLSQALRHLRTRLTGFLSIVLALITS